MSLLFFLKSERYIDESYDWGSFDLREWSEQTYRWQEDDWRGLRDTVQPVETTMRTGRGDCDDYARVALSYLTHRGTDADERGVAVLFRPQLFPPSGHMVVWDADRTYDSRMGVSEQTLGEFYDDNPQYTILISRKV